MPYTNEQIQLAEELLKKVGGLTIEDLYERIEKMGKNPTRKGAISQARFDGFKIGKGFLIDILNKIVTNEA